MTIWLLVSGTVFTLLIAVPLAVLAAARRGGVADNIIRAVPVVGLGLPSFWLGIMLILVFGLKLGLFPVGGVRQRPRPGTCAASCCRAHRGAGPGADPDPQPAREHDRGAEQRLHRDGAQQGARAPRVVLGHALRNAAVSSVTVLGVNIAYLIGSTLVVERVFSLPGIGQQMINAILGRDFPTVQGVTLTFAIMVVVVNLLTDLAHAALDPRVKLAMSDQSITPRSPARTRGRRSAAAGDAGAGERHPGRRAGRCSGSSSLCAPSARRC